MRHTRKRLQRKPAAWSVSDDELNRAMDYDAMCSYWEARARAVAMLAAAYDGPLTVHLSQPPDLDLMTLKGTRFELHLADKSPDAMVLPMDFNRN